MAAKTFKLPSKEEMLQRLLKVSDQPHDRQKFYPLLTRHAEEEKIAMGVVWMLQLAIYDSTQGLPPKMVTLLNAQMDRFIDALCPDEEIAAEAKVFYKEAIAATK